MADLLDDFETYIITNSLKDSYNIAKDRVPDDEKAHIALLEYGGSTLSPHVAGAIRPVQVRTVHPTYKEARNKAQELFASLLSDDGTVYLTTERWAVITALNTPIKIEEDKRGRTHFAFNVEIITHFG